MPHIDQGTFFALILTLCETIAIGGIAAVLLFPSLMGKPPEGDDASAKLPEPQPQVPAHRISWSLGASNVHATRQR